MSEATLILPNMRGGCATVGNTVHSLFRVTGRRPRAAGEQDQSVITRGVDREEIAGLLQELRAEPK